MVRRGVDPNLDASDLCDALRAQTKKLLYVDFTIALDRDL